MGSHVAGSPRHWLKALLFTLPLPPPLPMAPSTVHSALRSVGLGPESRGAHLGLELCPLITNKQIKVWQPRAKGSTTTETDGFPCDDSTCGAQLDLQLGGLQRRGPHCPCESQERGDTSPVGGAPPSTDEGHAVDVRHPKATASQSLLLPPGTSGFSAEERASSRGSVDVRARGQQSSRVSSSTWRKGQA